MLLKSFTKSISRPACNPNFQSVHCTAHLDEDISAVLPYLNAALGGISFIPDPASVTFQVHGKLITLHSKEIYINALKDETEADKILEWLKREINSTWEVRETIEPSYESRPVPRMMDILKLLPRTNCRKCGENTCTVFALRVAEGVMTPEDCAELTPEKRDILSKHLARFQFDL